MNNGSETNTVLGITSLAYHVTIWIIAVTGLLGNLMVLIWRCSKKESRYSLTSAFIVSLAVADFLFSCHYLIQEGILVDTVFGSDHNNTAIHVNAADKYLCLCILFISSVSAIGSMMTAVAISLAIFLSFHLYRNGKRMIISFLLFSWLFCLAFGACNVWLNRPKFQSLSEAEHGVSSSTLSLFVVYECTGDKFPDQWIIVEIIGLTINAMASLIVAIIYVYLWCKIRKRDCFFNTSQCKELSHFRTRLVIISGLNLLCWWPACFTYWYTCAKNVSIFDGTFSPSVSEPMRVLVAAACVANPIIYTIASKRFFKVIQRSCGCFRHRNKVWLPTVGPQDNRVLISYVESATQSTDDTSLFSEVD
jgi:hypothetical protein